MLNKYYKEKKLCLSLKIHYLKAQILFCFVMKELIICILQAAQGKTAPVGAGQPTGNLKKWRACMSEQKLTYRQREMLRRRGLNPDNYVLVRALYSTLYLRDIKTGKIKIITKNN